MNRGKKPHPKGQRKAIDKSVHSAQMSPETPDLNPSPLAGNKPSAGAKKGPQHKNSKRTDVDKTDQSQMFRKKR